jgi:multidrug efflux system outer membrane protein
VFYVALMKLTRKPKHAPAPQAPGSQPHVTGTAGAIGTAAILAVALLLLSTSSTRAGWFKVGPDYVAPTNAVPSEYKSVEPGKWKEGEPLDHLPKGPWWTVFNDETLNALEAEALESNQELNAALARLDQARATARIARSDLLPRLNLDPSYSRERFSPNQIPSFGNGTVDTFRAPLDLSYEIDLWGRVRRGFEGARADAQATLAAFHSLLLSLEADLAANYFALRAQDAEIATVVETVSLRREQVQLVQSRFEGGIGNDLDVARAGTELATTEAEAAALARRRAELENAIAILVGRNPSNFTLPPLGKNDWSPAPPEIPMGLPGQLLERRPDVGEAERRLAAANARIGVAKAAFFPVLSLTGSGGFVSADVDTLFNWDSRTWSIGPSLSLPIFAGGRNRANLKRSRSVYQEAIALYRQQVLVAFAEVENTLSGIRFLGKQAAAQERAVVHARRAAELASDRYRSGLVGYLEVVDANREALQTERARAQLAGQRLTAAVLLIKALGGGWTNSELSLTQSK